MPDASLTPEARERGDRDPASFEPSIEGTQRDVQRILDVFRKQEMVPFRELDRLGQGLLNTLAEAVRLREERNRARGIAVALEQENAHQTERLDTIRQYADGLEDHLPGDTWHLAHTIKQLAADEITVAEVLTEDGAQ
jgi:hypothetical protein